MAGIKNNCVILWLLGFVAVVAAQPQAQTSRQKATGEEQQSAPHVEMANVLFRYSPALTVTVVRLQGTLQPAQGHTVASFNQPDSFVIATNAAEMRMSAAQLSGLMNSWLLASPKAQLKDVHIETSGTDLLIRGTMKKGLHVPFSATATLGVSQDNRIRITASHMKAVHLPVKGLLDVFGLTMEDFVSQKGLKGMSVDGDSFLIDPQTAFPAPQIRARISRVQVAGQGIVLSFGDGAPNITKPPARNYIAMHGGNIQYGREEMFDSDLTMIDSTPGDPFEFYLGKYWCQMVAGNIKVTPAKGLRVQVPDFSKLPAGSCRQ